MSPVPQLALAPLRASCQGAPGLSTASAGEGISPQEEKANPIQVVPNGNSHVKAVCHKATGTTAPCHLLPAWASCAGSLAAGG